MKIIVIALLALAVAGCGGHSNQNADTSSTAAPEAVASFDCTTLVGPTWKANKTAVAYGVTNLKFTNFADGSGDLEGFSLLDKAPFSKRTFTCGPDKNDATDKNTYLTFTWPVGEKKSETFTIKRYANGFSTQNDWNHGQIFTRG